MATNGWDQYLPHIMGFYSKKKQEFTKTNICEACAIYGLDGSCWASSSDWPGLNEYEHPQELEDGTTKNLKVIEFNCAVGVTKGHRNPTAAGVRMGNQKFVMT